MSLEQNVLRKEDIENLTLKQGREIGEILKMPGWEIIENTILMTKYQFEAKRKTKLDKAARAEYSLYYSGCVDGAEKVRENVYELVNNALNLLESKKRESELQETMEND